MPCAQEAVGLSSQEIFHELMQVKRHEKKGSFPHLGDIKYYSRYNDEDANKIIITIYWVPASV